MVLTDHYTGHALAMAGLQAAACLGVLAYGLSGPSLGTHVVFLFAIMLLALGALAWLTLHRPWELSWPESAGQRGWACNCLIWEPGLLVAGTYGTLAGPATLMQQAKERLVAFRAVTTEAPLRPVEPAAEAWGQAWAADPLGHMLITDANMLLALLLPTVCLGLIWVFLPR